MILELKSIQRVKYFSSGLRAPPPPLKLVKKKMAATRGHKFRESSGHPSDKFLDPLLYFANNEVSVSFQTPGNKTSSVQEVLNVADSWSHRKNTQERYVLLTILP